MRTRALIPVITVTLLAAACGGGETEESGSTASTSTAPPTAEAASAADSSTTSTTTTAAVDDTNDPESDTTASEPALDEPTTPLAESAPVPLISIADIPDLVVAWGAATGNPLDVARRLIGFPLEINVPAASSPYGVRVELDGRNAAADWRWDWRYVASAVSEVGQIDAELPEGGPGTIEGRLHFEPLFASFGWRNVAQVISDPSSGGGGPQSVNWAYQKDDPNFALGGIAAEPISARAWVDEDIDFRDGDAVAGYTVEIALRSQPGVVAVPLLEALLREVPAVPGSRLIELTFASYDRTADSFLADEGLRYLDLTATWELVPGSETAAHERYSTALTGTAFQMGEESFFDEGFIRVTEANVDGNGVWRQPVIVLDRYPGFISVWTDDNGAVMSRIDITFEPSREVLEPLPE